MTPRQLLLIAFLSMIAGGCLKMGINLRYKTPTRASKNPKFSRNDSLKGSNSDFRSAFDVKHYRISLKIDPATKSIGGSVTTRFVMLRNAEKIQLDLHPGLTIDSITANGKSLMFGREKTAVFIDMRPVSGEQTITVHYHGKPHVANKPPWEGGFVWKKDKKKNVFAGVVCEGEGAWLWLPVKGFLGDEPDSITCRFTIPENLMVVGNGNLAGIFTSDGNKTVHWQTSYPINPYNITFYLGNYNSFSERFQSSGGDSVTLSYYVLPENESRARAHFKQVKSVLKIYEDLFGAYPWPRDGFKLVESPYAGMEHQTAIAYGNGYKNDMFGEADYIIVHEAAHEWWGNAVSAADFGDVWIHEGFATYAEALFLEQFRGRQAYLFHMRFIMMQVMNRKPVIGPREVYYWDYKDGDVYMKGAAVLHTLRNEVANDTLFFRLLKSFFKKYKYTIAASSDFERYAEEFTGMELTPFFNQYLYRRESPLLEWQRVNENGRAGIRYRLKRTDESFTLHIGVGSGSEEMTIVAGTTEKFLPLSSGEFWLNTGQSYLEVKEVKRW